MSLRTSNRLIAACALFGLSLAACADDQVVKPYREGDALGRRGDGDGDDDDDAPRATTSSKSKPKEVVSTTATTNAAPLTIDTKSCGGVSEPQLALTSVGAGTLPAATGGAISDATWVMQSAEKENAGALDLEAKRSGMIRFSGNRFAWHDGTFCAFGTFTTTGASLDMTVESTDQALNGSTMSVTYSVEPGGFTLKRGSDEAYHYVKE